MQAFRHIYNVEQNKIVIEFPPDFKHNQVEVIVLPFNKKDIKSSAIATSTGKEEILKDLLTVSVWDEKDLLPIIETSDLINQWKIDHY